MSVETGTKENHTIVDGLTAPPDKPAAAPLGASGQWQMLQPARLGRTPSEAQTNGASASNDLLIGAGRLPRSSSLTGSGVLCPAHLLPEAGKEAPSESSAGGSRLQSSQRVPGRHVPEAAKDRRRCPSHGLAATPTTCNTSQTPTRTGRPVVAMTRALACLSLRVGEGLRPCSFAHHGNLCAVPLNREAVHSARNQGAN